ncbi:MAG TPA: hypothetical protein VFW25_15940 [Silvibacterium sp.]|nr:hypothetical protein [Silvibacterium sp.]
MNSAGKSAALVVLSLTLVGCNRKPKATPPAAAQAPSLPVSVLAKNTPPPQLPPASLPKVTPAPPKSTPPPPKPKPEKVSRHKPRHTTVDASVPDQPAAQPPPVKQQLPEQASNIEPSDISPIGPLAKPGESTDVPRRDQIINEINSTEKGLDDLKRPLSRDEQTTATQIRTFLEKAKDSMKQEDLDGAHILVTKAKVLLAELTNP